MVVDALKVDVRVDTADALDETLLLLFDLVPSQVRHKPTVPLPLPGRKMEGKTSEETLQIRLYAVDCPEVAHFGNPAQPFSKEAKDVRRIVRRSLGYGYKSPVFLFSYQRAFL